MKVRSIVPGRNDGGADTLGASTPAGTLDLVKPVSPVQIDRRPQRTSLFVACAVGLSLVTILVRAALARSLQFCGTPDACYYLGMGQTLAAGRGFHARFLYDFQQAHPTLPNSGIEYWRPGISLLLAALRPLGAATLHGSIFLTICVGVLYAAAAWHLAMQTIGDRRLALGSFALCLLSAPAWIGSATPDSGLYYGAAVAWFLALFTVRWQGLAADTTALLCIACAYMIRNDAALLLVPLASVLWRRHRALRGMSAATPGGSSPLYATLVLAGFLLALVPMHLLYHHVLHTFFPGGTAKALYFNDLSDFERYGDPVSLRTLLSHGVKHLVVFRIATFATVAYRVAVLMIGYPALIFLPALASPQRRKGADVVPEAYALPEMTGVISFGVATLGIYALVLPAIGGFSALRSATGLMPFFSMLVVTTIFRVARSPRIAFLLVTAVVCANALAGVMEARRDIPEANRIALTDRDEAGAIATLHGNPYTSVVLTGDPVQFSVTTGYSTIALPNNGLDAIAAAARDFHVTHVILDSNNLPAALPDLTERLGAERFLTLGQEHSLVLELSHPVTPK